MRLAFCLIKYFPYGGLQRDCLEIATICRERGHQVDLFTRAWSGEIPAGLRVRVLPVFAWTNHRRRLALAHRLQREIAGRGYHGVVGFSKMPGLDLYYAADACYLERMRQRGFWYRLTPRFRAYRSLERAVFEPGAKTQVLLLSAAEKARYQAHYKTPDERFHLLPAGMGRDRLPPADATAATA